MNKLEYGMYVRTNEGIRKILNEYEEGYELDRHLHYLYPEGHDLYKEDLEDDEDEIVIKASFDIIDLIEVGDYVNGGKVIEIEKDYEFIDGTIRDVLWTDTRIQNAIWDETIKSIITKEQFKSMSYRIGDEK